MAAAIAASMPAPAPQAAPAPAPIEIPASMTKVIDVEAEIPIERVQLDGMVVMKIMKHARDASSGTATGLLLGLDLDGTLEVSNSFALPTHGDDDEKGPRPTSAKYQASMLKLLEGVNADDTIVGFYQSSAMGAFFQQSLVDLQTSHQERLRHGGVVVVHDTSAAARANAVFRAFRLTPAFLDAARKDKFGTQSLIKHELIFSRIFEEIPIIVRNSPLLNAFMNTLTTPSPQASLATPPSILSPPFAPLDLDPTSLVTRNLEAILDTMESQKNEESNVSYAHRQIAREKAKADAYVAKRKEESAMRVAQGLAPLPEEDVSRLFRIPAEPSRLEGMLYMGQIDAQAKTLDLAASANLVKMYAARAGAASS